MTAIEIIKSRINPTEGMVRRNTRVRIYVISRKLQYERVSEEVGCNSDNKFRK